MTKKDEYVKDINQLKNETITDLEALLVFAKKLLSTAKFKHHIKAKTVLR